MRKYAAKLQTAFAVAAVILLTLWVISGFLILNSGHVWIGQGVFLFRWGAPFGYGVFGNKGQFFQALFVPEYTSLVVSSPRIVAHYFKVPLLPIVISLAVASLLLRWLRPSVIPLTACQACGYDLTGNTSGVCPECGEQFREVNL